jgi:hypothetical protein
MYGQQLTVPMNYSKDQHRSDCTHSPELGNFTIASATIVAKERSLHVCTVHKDSKCKDPIIVIKGDIKRVGKAPSVSYVQCASVRYMRISMETSMGMSMEIRMRIRMGENMGQKMGTGMGIRMGTASSRMIEEAMVGRGTMCTHGG